MATLGAAPIITIAARLMVNGKRETAKVTQVSSWRDYERVMNAYDAAHNPIHQSYSRNVTTHHYADGSIIDVRSTGIF